MGVVPRVWRVGRGRWWRPLYLAALAYSALVIAANAVVLAAMLAARVLGNDPRADDPSLPAIDNLRRVDDRLWAGATAADDEYRQLAAMGVSLVVDLTTGRPGDEGDDPAFIRSVGMDYLRLPVTDGHASDAATVRRFVEAVEGAGGLVYMHCGGGVGRSSALQAAYVAVQGRDVSLVEMLAIGPPTIEQVWAIYSSDAGRPSDGNPVVAALSRFVFDGPRTAVNWLVDRIL